MNFYELQVKFNFSYNIVIIILCRFMYVWSMSAWEKDKEIS